MLSRTADDIFWVARYVERAENLARLLEVADRMSKMPAETNESQEWASVLTAGGVEEGYDETHSMVTPEAALDFIAFDDANPSSITNCIRAARENARAQRHAITRDLWEALNEAWFKVRAFEPEKVKADGLTDFVETVKQSSHLVRGSLTGTMLRDDLYRFLRLGTFVERAESTARILDIKYHVVLPPRKPLGGATDYYHWNALLRSVSADGSYRRVFSDRVDSLRVAELLTVRREMPRSILSCYEQILENLEGLSREYGRPLESQRMAGRLCGRLRYNTIQEIVRGGLHEFLTEVIDENMRIATQIRVDFHLIPESEETEPA